MPSRIRIFLRDSGGYTATGKQAWDHLCTLAPATLRKMQAKPNWNAQPLWRRCRDLASGLSTIMAFQVFRERRKLATRESHYRQALHASGQPARRTPPRSATGPSSVGAYPLIGRYGQHWGLSGAWALMPASFQQYLLGILRQGGRHFRFQGRSYDAYGYIQRFSEPPSPPRPRPRSLSETAVQSGLGVLWSNPPTARPSGPYSPPLGIWRQ